MKHMRSLAACSLDTRPQTEETSLGSYLLQDIWQFQDRISECTSRADSPFGHSFFTIKNDLEDPNTVPAIPDLFH